MADERFVFVTIDTEVDKDPRWRVANPATFRSVLEGIPRLLTPLFDRYGVKPTYLLSPEVIEDRECVSVLRSLGERAELGTHLHSEFIEPDRSLSRTNMAGSAADAIQRQYPPKIEEAKLANLTALFNDAFGRAPTSFRAGRYGMSSATLEILARLGYKVDSSVTPGLRWKYKEGILDYRSWSPAPRWIDTAAGRILELPLSIRPGARIARCVREWPNQLQRVARAVFGRRVYYQWLRPSWTAGHELVGYVRESDERLLNLMFHSMEIIPGASPHAQTDRDVQRILAGLEQLFAFCADRGFAFCGLTDAVAHV